MNLILNNGYKYKKFFEFCQVYSLTATFRAEIRAFRAEIRVFYVVSFAMFTIYYISYNEIHKSGSFLSIFTL